MREYVIGGVVGAVLMLAVILGGAMMNAAIGGGLGMGVAMFLLGAASLCAICAGVTCIVVGIDDLHNRWAA